MSEYWHAPPGRELVSAYYFQDNDRLPQYRTEEVLRARMADAAERRDAASAGRRRAVEQDDDGVARRSSSGTASGSVLEADYVVGCDGGHSLVREQIGIERGGTDFDQLMVLAVFRSRELHECLERFPERSTYRVMHPDLKGYWMFFGRVDVGEGFFFHAPVPRGHTRDNFDFPGLLQRAAGLQRSRCEFDYVGFWDLRIAVAETYQVGRVFIAGDAAHSHPPYGGFGLNNGLEDAANLGWKLAARAAGLGRRRAAGVLRRGAAAGVPRRRRGLHRRRIRDDRAFLERYSPERDREEFERGFEEQHQGASAARLQDYEPHYEGSPVVLGPPGGVCSAHGTHTFKARAGHHLPPQLLSSGATCSRSWARFTLLAFDADDAAVEAFEQAAEALGVPLTVVRDSFADGRDGLRGAADPGAPGPVHRLDRRRAPGRCRRGAADGHRTRLTPGRPPGRRCWGRVESPRPPPVPRRRSAPSWRRVARRARPGRRRHRGPREAPDPVSLRRERRPSTWRCSPTAWSTPGTSSQAPDGTLLVDERGRWVRRRPPRRGVRSVDADLDDLFAEGETGLMGLALDPAFSDNRRFYSCQGVEGDGGASISVIALDGRRRWSAATRVNDPLVGGIPVNERPGGTAAAGCGRTRRGAVVGTGDTARGTNPQDPGRWPARCCGSPHRRPRPATPSGPRSGPYGHRNVQGLAVRPGTGQVCSVEHGPDRDDEVNLLCAGANYGWDPAARGYDEGVPMTDRHPGAVAAVWSSGGRRSPPAARRSWTGPVGGLRRLLLVGVQKDGGVLGLRLDEPAGSRAVPVPELEDT